MGLISAGHQRLAVSSTAVGFTVPTPTDRSVEEAHCRVSDADIVWESDGTTPTATDGSLFRAGDEFKVKGQSDIANFKAIRLTSTDAVLWISYWRQED